MLGADGIRVGRIGKGDFAVQIRVRKDDPIAPYVVAAIEKAACIIRDPVTGFEEVFEGDASVADDLIHVLLQSLPEDLQARFSQETSDARARALAQIDEAITGMGLGNLLAGLGAMGPQAKRDVEGASGPLGDAARSLPDAGDVVNRVIRPDTRPGRELLDHLDPASTDVSTGGED